MTPEQLRDITRGHEGKPWWPKYMHFTADSWWHGDHVGVPSLLVEQAVIGSAVAWLVTQGVSLRVEWCGRHYHVGSHESTVLVEALLAQCAEVEAQRGEVRRD